ncbi:hypothetical protein MH117_06280 [Paenibacillus sp. ACRRX]|uniref:hypothetical protein n=1 Tax=Paenibacillus sp. ACRRX TaxID=2918206 RepID=UPI001EF59D64|nr:hypothetical protein [Paenibacillus sp. ACRRX]MCG7407021.1 hypothetical protein [Paenibacillus sp. ACRRX]
MKAKGVAIVTFMIVLSLLIGCSKEAPVQVDDVEASLTTNPETIVAGRPVELQVAFTGMQVSEKATVTFDIRADDKPELFDAVYKGDNVFSGSFTFSDKGKYSVYVHLFGDDVHLTRKKTVEVK